MNTMSNVTKKLLNNVEDWALYKIWYVLGSNVWSCGWDNVVNNVLNNVGDPIHQNIKQYINEYYE